MSVSARDLVKVKEHEDIALQYGTFPYILNRGSDAICWCGLIRLLEMHAQCLEEVPGSDLEVGEGRARLADQSQSSVGHAYGRQSLMETQRNVCKEAFKISFGCMQRSVPL
jgi:hypothetical protein